MKQLQLSEDKLDVYGQFFIGRGGGRSGSR